MISEGRSGNEWRSSDSIASAHNNNPTRVIPVIKCQSQEGFYALIAQAVIDVLLFDVPR
jgi:hypothetical protein